jgi:hypothetical protein
VRALQHACIVGFVLVASSPVSARPSTTLIPSAPGRIHCYTGATSAGLERWKAIRLCRGATSDMPARCADAAIDRVGLSEQHAIRLCRVAKSTDPVTCAARLSSLGLEDREVVGYCAAMPWPLVAARFRGSVECVERALDRTLLTDVEAMHLCRGSGSLAPVECFEVGDDATLLDDRDLVELCAPVMPSAPIAVPPAARR